MISAVILNWNRPKTLVRIILPILERYSRISEIVISHGKQETAFDYKSRFCRIVHREDWELNKDWGIARRFIAAREATNEIIWQQDDDLLIPEETIEELLIHYRRQPEILHGLFGRRHTRSLNYQAHSIHGDMILLGAGGVLYKRDLAARCFDPEYREIHDFVRNNSVPLWNGEDLFHSLVTFKNSGLPNKSYNLPYVDLVFFSNNDQAVCRQPEHRVWRTKFLRYAVPKMGLQEKLNGFIEKNENSCIAPVAKFDRIMIKSQIIYLLLTIRKTRFIGRWALSRWIRKRWQQVTEGLPPNAPGKVNTIK